MSKTGDTSTWSILLTGLLVSWLSGCGNGEQLDVFVAFPDQASLDATELLRVVAIEPAETSSCAALLSGEAGPGDSGYPIEQELENPLSASGNSWRLSGVGPGRRLFFAQAKNSGGTVFLHGCTDKQVAGGGLVEIVLSEPEFCSQDSDCQDANPCTVDSCAAGACDHQQLPAGTPCDGEDNDFCNSTCDVSGSCAGDPVVCDDQLYCNGIETCDSSDGSCQPGANQPAGDYCLGDDLVSCDGTGVQTAQDTCEFGCNPEADPDRCRRLAPSNLNPELLCQNAYDLVISAPVEIDADAGTITGIAAENILFSAVDQGVDLPPIGVFSFNSVVIHSPVTVVGSNSLALLSCREVTVTAEIDLCAQGQTAGPGGKDGGRRERDGLGYLNGFGLAGGSNVQPPINAGGGGGGFGGLGGSGGTDADETIPGGAGGQFYADQTGLVPLLGGSGGGGGGGTNDGGFGGGGGGVIQISAGSTLTIESGAGINACGGGGGAALAVGGAGGGGGSGGAILLEASDIVVEGVLAANGGGGGGGWAVSDTPVASDGQAGQLSYTPANGGAAGGEGGDGAGGGAASLPDGKGALANSAGGGGGGAAGRIQLNTRSGQYGGSGRVSPNPSQGTINTW